MDIWGLKKKDDDDVLSYMNKRYGEKFHDEFEIKDVEYGRKEHRYYMASRNMPLYRLDVRGNKGKYIDNYMPLYYIPQYEEFMTNTLTPEIGECKVISEITIEMSDVPPDMGFEEYLHCGKISFDAVILASQKTDIQIYAEKICQKIKELNVEHGLIMVRVLNDYTQSKNIKTYYDLKKFNTSNNPYYSDNTLCLNQDLTLRTITKGIF